MKVGTIFEDSALGLDKWIVAVWCIVNAKNGISSCELARAIGVTQKSAWHMLHRIRLAMQTKSFRRITGEIESDESAIGGRLSNMSGHRKSKAQKRYGRFGRKTLVHGLLERAGEIRAKVVPDSQRGTIEPIVRENVEKGSTLYSDIGSAYFCGYYGYLHRMVNHSLRYVEGRIHTNGMENFWSLLKRCLHGTYVAVEPQHLQRYLDEQCRRFNMRKGTDSERFHQVMGTIVGKRLTYAELIGERRQPQAT